MVKRFVEDVQIQPQQVATGAAQAQESLASRLEAFAGQTRQLQSTLGGRGRGTRGRRATHYKRSRNRAHGGTGAP